MPAPLQCTCVQVDKTPTPGRAGVFDYSFECTWNEGDTNSYNIDVTWTNDLEARVKAEAQCPYDNKNDDQ